MLMYIHTAYIFRSLFYRCDCCVKKLHKTNYMVKPSIEGWIDKAICKSIKLYLDLSPLTYLVTESVRDSPRVFGKVSFLVIQLPLLCGTPMNSEVTNKCFHFYVLEHLSHFFTTLSWAIALLFAKLDSIFFSNEPAVEQEAFKYLWIFYITCKIRVECTNHTKSKQLKPYKPNNRSPGL